MEIKNKPPKIKQILNSSGKEKIPTESSRVARK